MLYNASVGGLARFSVHMNATWILLLKATKNPLSPQIKKLGLPITHRDNILQNLKSGSSHVMHHASQIACDILSLTKYLVS